MMELETLQMVLRLVVALVLGALIGLNRRIYGKPAGLRTMALVSLGSATFTIVGVNAMLQLANAEQAAGLEMMVRLDTSRVIAGIVGGIGFLGAGAIIQSRGRVQGMTTASGIWMTAAIGVASGLGQFTLALTATFLAFVVLVILRRTIEDEEEEDL
ncbi:MAG: MgtC/SapB family protein [Phycisphaerales bacterium]|jgi:putative Mg2+ transporter-C (MgtC) family protein|nr:MgtC/SapB family protein [Phycisphaerales bacterium]